ncbi:MAG TPA: MlaE family lipid ABC transporter permease subunit [Polyangia bacterium]|jgi:phospholipid/cholesterol/gamma-HCH transport system permease protein
MSADTAGRDADLHVGGDGIVVPRGEWRARRVAALERRLARFPWPPGPVRVDLAAVEAMDTAGALLLRRTVERLRADGREVNLTGVRPELGELLELLPPAAALVPTAPPPLPGRLERLGRRTAGALGNAVDALAFVGATTATIARVLLVPTRMRWRALLRGIENDGFNALPITALLSFLMGIVIGYQAAEQLRSFGANIFIVDLVGISVLREIAPLVTGIIVASRSGSSYTAEIGTMMVNEEVDALRTVGISPLELLVAPRVLGLLICVPLLTLVADLVGIGGGMLMAKTQLGVSGREFLDRLKDAVPMRHYLIGLLKAPVFACLIATVGCYQGLKATGGAAAVGRRTTVSVVQAIFLVIVSDAFFSIIFNWANL